MSVPYAGIHLLTIVLCPLTGDQALHVPGLCVWRHADQLYSKIEISAFTGSLQTA